MGKRRGNRIYSWNLREKVESQLPSRVLNTLSVCGWNVFGVYELVEEEIKKQKREMKAKAKPPT